jgi:hypothetical protein
MHAKKMKRRIEGWLDGERECSGVRLLMNVVG